MRTRWETIQRKAIQLKDSPHPVRPFGFQSFALAHWQRLFESMDPGFMEAPVEFRHPYLDLRLLRYMLAVPSVPWCRRKHLMRQAMRNILPDEILRRDKSPLPKSPAFETIRRSGMPPLVPTEELFEFVNPHNVPSTMPSDALELWMNLRPLVLNHWLWCSNLDGVSTQEELKNGYERQE